MTATIHNIKDYKRKKKDKPPREPRQIICAFCQTNVFSIIAYEGKFKTVCSLCTKISELKI